MVDKVEDLRREMVDWYIYSLRVWRLRYESIYHVILLRGSR